LRLPVDLSAALLSIILIFPFEVVGRVFNSVEMKFKRISVILLTILDICVNTNSAQVKCGRKSVASGNVHGGEPAKLNEWPWLVALRHQNAEVNKFFCGGTLISKRHVLSGERMIFQSCLIDNSSLAFLFPAAHCFENKHRREADIKKPLDVTAWMGKHNLDRADEEGSASYRVLELTLHEDWKYDEDDFDADIALLTLETEVDLTNRRTVRIICLPQPSSSEVTETGTVVGWGISERSEADGEHHDSKPNKLELPAVTKQQCYNTSHELQMASSDRTFCAGFVNQSKSACKGDSGGGFYVYHSSTRTYYIGGIVSASLHDPYGGCRTDTYSIFTDVNKFVDWIREKMEKTSKYIVNRGKLEKLLRLDRVDVDVHHFDLPGECGEVDVSVDEV
jgi:serine protease 56